MSRIKRVSVTNLHGMSFTHQLELVNVICGHNYAGKSAIAKAIRLGLTGSLPLPIGKTGAGIYKLAGNPTKEGWMTIELETDDKRCVQLKWERNDKGAVKTIGSVPTDLAMPELLCEPKVFFGKTGPERMKILFDACDLSKSGFSASELIKRLVSVQVTPITTCEATLDEVSKYIARVFSAEGATIQAKTDALVTELKARHKRHDDEAKAKSGSFNGLRSRLTERPSDLSADIAKLEHELQQLGTLSTVDFERKANGAEQAARNLVDLGILPDYRENYAKKCYDMETSIEKLREELAKEKGKKIHDTAEATTRLGKLHSDIQEKERQLNDKNAAVSGVNQTRDAVALLKLCAKCKKSLEASLSNQLRGFVREGVELTEELSRLGSQRDSLTDTIASQEEGNSEREGNIANIESNIETVAEALRDLHDAFNIWKDNSDALSAMTKPDTSKADELKVQLADLREKQKAFTQYQSDINRRNDLEGELLVEQCRAEVYKQVAKLVTDEQKKVIEFAFNNVLKVTRAFTDGLLNSPLEFSNGELGRRVAEDDLNRGCKSDIGSWISHETFSGTEELLTYCAFGVALCQDAPMKIVFMDELGRIEETIRVAVIRRMASLVKAGTIDQFIGIDTSAKPYKGVECFTLEL